MEVIPDALWSWTNQFNGWLIEYEPAIIKVGVGTMSVGFFVLGIIKIVSWFALRGTRDQTDVGKSLKPQKLSEGILYLAMSVLYGITLSSLMRSSQLELWHRLALWVIAVLSISVASIFGVRFIMAYYNEGWGRATTGIKQALRDAQQNDRDASQDRREVRQDQRSDTQQRREDKWEARSD